MKRSSFKRKTAGAESRDGVADAFCVLIPFDI